MRPAQVRVDTRFSPDLPVSPGSSLETQSFPIRSHGKAIDGERVIEYVEERATILEYDGGTASKDAEREAVRLAIGKFGLTDAIGNPAFRINGDMLGALDDLLKEFKTSVNAWFPSRDAPRIRQ